MVTYEERKLELNCWLLNMQKGLLWASWPSDQSSEPWWTVEGRPPWPSHTSALCTLQHAEQPLHTRVAAEKVRKNDDERERMIWTLWFAHVSGTWAVNAHAFLRYKSLGVANLWPQSCSLPFFQHSPQTASSVSAPRAASTFCVRWIYRFPGNIEVLQSKLDVTNTSIMKSAI